MKTTRRKSPAGGCGGSTSKVKKPRPSYREINEKYVRQGTLYICPEELIDKGDDKDELEEMNKGKRGRRYIYTTTYIFFCGLLKTLLSLPDRQVEGILKGLSRLIPGLMVPDYTTLNRRLRKMKDFLKSKFKDICSSKDGEFEVVVDSTGFKVTNRGDWLRKKHGKVRRGWIKVHILVDPETKEVLVVEVTDEKTSDAEGFEPLLDELCENLNGADIKRVIGDGGYDAKRVFNLLEKGGIESGIKPRKNSSTQARGSPYRAKCVREFKDLGYEKWKNKVGYTKRWLVESVFSSIKRRFGESVRAVSRKGMEIELFLRFICYNMLLN